MTSNYRYRGLFIVAATALLLAIIPVVSHADDGSSSASAAEAVSLARQALANAEFDALVALLEPTLSRAETEPPAEAHLLYALGLLFEARGADNPDDLTARATGHIEVALDIEPELQLDTQLYPQGFIQRVEEVQSRRRDANSGAASASATDQSQIFYFERRVETRSRLPLFLPAGSGQFHNGDTFRGITYATVQVLGLALNITAYWLIESMRSPAGHIRSEDLGSARNWRRAQFGGLALFGAGWLASVIDANMSFQPQNVRIRTLDGPPPELTEPRGDVGLPRSLQLEWTFSF